jgi:hypothetical protein
MKNVLKMFKKYLTPVDKIGRNINILDYPFCDSHVREARTLLPDGE